MIKNFKKRAFTLAEVLITLAIIGTIAAMTIPSLFTNVKIEDKANDAGIKKTLRAISDTTKEVAMLNTTGHSIGSLTCGTSGANATCLRDTYANYLAYIKVCSSSKQTDCLLDAPAKSQQFKEDGTTAKATVDFSGRPLAVLADGTLLGFFFDATCNTTTTAVVGFKAEPQSVTKTCANIAVDVNGSKGPNTVGRDRYLIPIGKTRVKYAPATGS